MIATRIQEALKRACEKEGVTLDVVELTHPAELSHGDYATNIALAAAKQVGVSPKEFAERIVANLGSIEGVEKVEIAGPGFINFFLTRDFFAASIRDILSKQDSWGMGDALQGKKVMVEYTQPNPFKPFHIGHLMTNTIGESVACMVEAAGGEVMRVNYQGDVGLHVAKALWGLKQKNVPADDVEKIGEAYVYGNAQYEENETARAEIVAINKQVYARDLAILETYEIGKKVSLAHFEELYKILGTKFDHYFFESETAKLGKQLVEEGLEKNVFEKSDGAVVFHGEQ
jgi:arginyl-tRNA synthetase